MLGQHSHNSIQPYQQQLPTAPSQSPSARQDDHHNQPSSSSAASRSAPAATTKKKTLKRKLASCSGCRRRRTRCDRILPCSECLRRNSKCDYEGASLPPIAARRDLDDKSEREEYIKKLEDRVRTLESSNSHHPSPPDNSSSLPEIDFSADDIAFQLSKITLGQRLKSTLSRSAPVHPIQSQFQHLFSSGFTRTSTPFFEVDQSFTLDLVSATSSLSLSTLLSDYLPTRAQIDKLSKIYLESVNLWSPCINPISWTVLFNRFWAFPNRLSFRPNPESDQEGCNTYHQLAHFTACIFAINGHGLLRLADIHQLRPEGHGLSSPQPPGHNSNYPDPEFGNLSQSQKISLAHSWFKYAMGLLVGEEGQVFVKPTSFGIRAMALLGCVELAPENFDRAIFFWSLTCNSAAKAGLLNEPPVTEDENLDMVDEYELESRRHLSWFILSLDWAGATIAGDLRYRCDPCKYDVTIPGEIPSTFNEIDPNDGWPLDLITCMRKAAALSDRIMHQASLKFLSGNLATYKDVLETERSMLQLEESLPSRIQSVMSQDGKSLRPKVESDYFGLLISLFMAGRFSTSRVRLHRLFILPRPGVSAQERNRHMESLLLISKRQFLATQQFPHSLNMHPLMLYSLTCTAAACALALLMAVQEENTKLTADLDFFIAEFKKVVKLLSLGKLTVSSSLARKSATLLEALMQKIEEHSREHNMAFDRAKKGSVAHTRTRGDELFESSEEPRRKVPAHSFNGQNSPPQKLSAQSCNNLQAPVCANKEGLNSCDTMAPLPSRSDQFSSPTYSPPSNQTLRCEPQLNNRAVSYSNHRPVVELPHRVPVEMHNSFGVCSPRRSSQPVFSFQQPLPSLLHASTSSSVTSSIVPMTSSSVEFPNHEYYAPFNYGDSTNLFNLTTEPKDFNKQAGQVGNSCNPIRNSVDVYSHQELQQVLQGHHSFRQHDNNSESLNVFDPDFLLKLGISSKGMVIGREDEGGGGRIQQMTGAHGGVGEEVPLNLSDPFQASIDIGWSPGDSLGSSSSQNLNSKEISNNAN